MTEVVVSRIVADRFPPEAAPELQERSVLKIGHTVTIPVSSRGPAPEAEPETIAIPEELVTGPGVPQHAPTINFYSQTQPLENHTVEQFAYTEWLKEVTKLYKEALRILKPHIRAAAVSGDIEPTAEPIPGKDVTKEVTAKAMELGFCMVGMTTYDHRYTYVSRRAWVKRFPHAICVATEQGYEDTQKAASYPSELEIVTTLGRSGPALLDLADYIRSLGYHAQVQHPVDPSSVIIPMFVEAGLGQLGANGQLLSPHFGSRARLAIITTDAPVTVGQPKDYGIQAYCQICQVCVNRCPGRALTRDKVWYRGVERSKLVAKRCRPFVARYSACAVCMKVCPVQMYGMKPVMEHYAATGQVLGKGTHLLEGYELNGVGYFGPGELPKFDSDFFNIPEGPLDQKAFKELKAKIESGEAPEGPKGDKVFEDFRDKIRGVLKGPQDGIDPERGKV